MKDNSFCPINHLKKNNIQVFEVEGSEKHRIVKIVYPLNYFLDTYIRHHEKLSGSAGDINGNKNIMSS